MPALDRGGRPKPDDAPLASHRSTLNSGGRANPGNALWWPALNRGLHQARRCPSNGPALDRGVALSQVMPLWRASAGHSGHAKPGKPPLTYQRGVEPSLAMSLLCGSDTQRGHAKPGDAPMACHRLTGGSCQARRCLSGGPVLDTGCAKPCDAPLAGQHSTGELREAR